MTSQPVMSVLTLDTQNCSGDPTWYFCSTNKGLCPNKRIYSLAVSGWYAFVMCGSYSDNDMVVVPASYHARLVDSGLHEESVSLPGTPTTCICTVQPNCLTLYCNCR